jgi:clathrin heavy chain
MEYINRLDKFDGLDIAAICVSEGLFEEAFVIYKKFDDKPKAIGVLVESLKVSLKNYIPQISSVPRSS